MPALTTEEMVIQVELEVLVAQGAVVAAMIVEVTEGSVAPEALADSARPETPVVQEEPEGTVALVEMIIALPMATV